jgi:ribose-phosphate pyrophosphokinase
MALKKLRAFTGNANPEFARKIVDHMGIPLSRATVKSFSDDETWVELDDNVRGADVFIIQPTCTPADKHFMELAIMIDACRRASAKRITAVMPYYGYARQDKKVKPKTPITAKAVAVMLESVGVKRVLTMDLHAGQIQGFFHKPVDHLHAMPVMLDDISAEFVKKLTKRKLVMVSPDAGGVERTRAFAKRLNAGLAIIDKRRDKPNESKVMHVIGDVKGKTAILLDDMVDTAGTLCNGAEALINNGAKEVHACCTHPVLSGPALKRITKSKIKTLTVSDTIPLNKKAQKCKKIRVVSVAEMFGDAIRCIYEEDSLTSLFA